MANMAESLAAEAVLRNNQEPLDHLDDIDEDGEDSPMVDEERDSYADVASGTWELTLHLYRNDKANDFIVTPIEASRLIFNRLNVPQNGLVSFDNTPYKKLYLELKREVTPQQLNITQALEVRPGLYTRPLQAPDQDKLIRIAYAPVKMKNADIDKVIGIFAEVRRKTEHVVIKANENSCEWEKLMDGVKTSERTVIVRIIHNIPSYILVNGVKLRIDYTGQAKTCGRCHKYWSTCPGGGKMDKCKKAKGEEKPLKIAFKQLVNRIKKKEVSPQESASPLVPGNIPTPDEIVFSGFKEDVSIEQFYEWLDSNEVQFVAVMVFKGTKPGTFSISNVEDDTGEKFCLEAEEAKNMVEKLHGAEHDGRRIAVTMVCLTTPKKVKKQVPVIQLDNTNSPPPSDQLALPAPGDVAGTSGTGADSGKTQPASDSAPAKEAEKEKQTGKAARSKKGKGKEKNKTQEEEKKDGEKKEDRKGKGGNGKKSDKNVKNTKEDESQNEKLDSSVELSESEEVVSNSQRLKLTVKAVSTQGGSKTHKVINTVAEKHKRESTSGSEGGSPVLTSKNNKKSPSNKQERKKAKGAQQHHNF